MSGTRASGIAVVVPAYRPGATITEALRSALGQTLPPDEIVVVDDGSPEPLDSVLDPWLDRILLARQPNAGPGAARNTGIALTTAPWIAFLDADDVWEPGKLAAQRDVLARDWELAMVCSDCWVLGGGDEPRRKHGAGFDPDLSVSGLVEQNTVVTSTVVIRRDVVEAAGGFDEDRELIAVEDFDLWLRVAECWRIGYADAPLARYRVAESSLSTPATFVAGVRRVLEKFVRRSEAGSDLRPAARRRMAALWRDLAWSLLEGGQARAALPPILESLALHPGERHGWKLLARATLQRIPLARRVLARFEPFRAAFSRA